MVEANKNNFHQELIENARKLVRPGFGILAADESTGTIAQRFQKITVENTEENRRAYRDLLFTTEGIEKYISGVILFEETLGHSTGAGVNFIQQLKNLGILSGIKVDKGLVVIPGTNDESATQGLDGLAERCKKYYEQGVRFAKWRAVLKIGDGRPSKLAIRENAHSLARYGAICQANGLVPIIEPEILQDGTHSIEECARASEKVFAGVMKALLEHGLLIEGLLLKPNMVTPGAGSTDRKSAAEIAWYTVRTLSRTIVPALPGIVFLSGGQSEEEASQNLNEMNKLTNIQKPWALSFSYGRALQSSTLKAWGGKTENVKAGQDALLVRAKANSEATLGTYAGGSGGETTSQFVANYSY